MQNRAVNLGKFYYFRESTTVSVLPRFTRISAAALALGVVAAGVSATTPSAPAHSVVPLVIPVTTTVDLTTLIDCDDGGSGTSLREAVCMAHAGSDSTVQLPEGVYPLISPLWVTAGMTIVGAGMNETTIDASSTLRAIEATSTSLGIQDLTIIGGNAGLTSGGGVYAGLVDTTLENVRVTGGVAEYGGGIASLYGSLTLVDSIIDGNTATTAGGGIYSVGVMNMQGTTVSGNSAPFGGGLALHSNPTDFLTIKQSTISGNAASDSGGGIAVDGYHNGQTTITDTTIAGNTAVNAGGAVYSAGSSFGDILLSSTTVTGNEATALGGGIVQVSGTVIVNHSIVAENTGGDLDGAVGGQGNIVGIAGGSVVDGVDGNQAGSVAAPLDPQLRPLGSFGGPTQTRVPLPSSPAIDSAQGCGTEDQRGESRPVGAGCDIGAVELTAAPDTSIVTSPASQAASSDAVFAFAASGGTAPYSFVCDLDASGTFAPCSSAATFSGLLEGSHTLSVQASDSLGVTDLSAATYSWTVDITSPTVTWGSVSPGTASGSTSTFAFSATDASGVASFECSLDGVSFTACASPVTTAVLADGAHNFRVRAIDAFGNVSEPVAQTWNVAAAPPLPPVIPSAPPAAPSSPPLTSPGIEIIESTPTAAVGGSVTFAAKGFAPGSLVNLYIYSTPELVGSAQADSSGVVRITGDLSKAKNLKPGQHTLVAAGWDANGNAVYASRTINIEDAAAGGSPNGVAVTGSAPEQLAFAGIAGLALFVAGGVLILARRRAAQVK